MPPKNQFQSISLTLLLFLCWLFIANQKLLTHEQQIRIGTFNIEWLGDGNKDTIKRTENDYIAIAKVIETINCDVLALQEIENEDALKIILQILKNKYRYFIDSTSSNNLKVAILYDKTFEKIDEQFIHFSTVAMTYKRPALYIKLKKDKQEFEFISTHLKSSHRKKAEKSSFRNEKVYSPQEIRAIQAEELISWMKNNQKKHSIVMGDFNEEYEKGTILKRFEQSFQSTVISKDLISCANNKWKMIDHIILPEHFRKRFKTERLQNYNHRVLSSSKNAPKISDHCLLYYTLSY